MIDFSGAPSISKLKHMSAVMAGLILLNAGLTAAQVKIDVNITHR